MDSNQSQATLARAVVAAHGVEATAAAMGPAQGRAVMHLLGGAPDDDALNAEVGGVCVRDCFWGAGPVVVW